MLTKRNKQGYAVPASCHYAECDYRHCHDCAFVGRDGLLEIIENLRKYEETGLTFAEDEER